MGTGIGIVASRVANLDVTFVDPGAETLKKSEAFVINWCQKEIAKERMSAADMDSVMSRITWSSEINSLSNADFVIEAVNEDFGLKKKIF
jgi:3-hydroxyacyl-CoA dehydrogenase